MSTAPPTSLCNAAKRREVCALQLLHCIKKKEPHTRPHGDPVLEYSHFENLQGNVHKSCLDLHCILTSQRNTFDYSPGIHSKLFDYELIGHEGFFQN